MLASGVLRAVRIDESGLGSPSAARREEWRLAAAELVEDHSFALEPPFELELAVSDDGAALRCIVEGGDAVALALEHALLAPHLDEYLGVCRTLARLDEEGAASPRLEALDMAKKVAHDRAAQMLVARLAPLAPDHRTARRIFTLLVTLLFDTTSLASLRAHRAR